MVYVISVIVTMVEAFLMHNIGIKRNRSEFEEESQHDSAMLERNKRKDNEYVE